METPTSTIVSTGDLGGQKVGMQIDSSAMAHIMSILTDLYSDPQMAVIREYATNALDAHIEAGITTPIEVFTPNTWSPFFRVVDHGVGLSIDDIVDMYSKYGASSKRGTNTQVGMLGLGAKSALTLVPQFTLTSVKGGVKIFVSISRNADGAGEMEIIDTVATDEPNGVEISIPVPRSHNFMEKVNHFFRFWKKGTVLVDGKEPGQIEGRPVADKFIISPGLGKDYVVMGSVAYPVKDGLWDNGYNSKGIVAYVNIGDINFTPSREDLQYTNKTRETLRSLKDEFKNSLVASALKDIDESKTYTDAWNKANEWRQNFGHQFNSVLTYKGVQIPRTIPFDTFTVTAVPAPAGVPSWQARNAYQKQVEGKVYGLTGGQKNRYHSNLREVTPAQFSDYLFITGFADSMKMSPTQREKAAIYVAQNSLKAIKAVIFNRPAFITDADHMKFLDGISIVDWSVLAKIKVQRNASGNRIIRTDPYDLYDGSYSKTQVSVLDDTKPIIYYSSADLHNPQWLSEIFPDGQLIILSRNRWDKFKRDWPTAEYYAVALQKKINELVKTFTFGDKVLWHHSSSRYQAKYIDPNQINDPDLAAYVAVLQAGVQYSNAAKQVRGLMSRGVEVTVEVPDNPLTKYPMLGNIELYNKDHAHWYINAYYAHFTNTKEN